MESISRPIGAGDDKLDEALMFLQTIFAPSDLVLFRPIESWTENGKKRSRVVPRSTEYRRAEPQGLQHAIDSQRLLAAGERANLFFGVCPRFGEDGHFDLAWQIRVVRCLWSDMDGVTVEEALARCQKAVLPSPSVVVNSGHGAHLYWVLEQPFLIDDAGDPPAVHTDWSDPARTSKRRRKYASVEGKNLYLDEYRELTQLSEKAQHIQDVIAGIAHAIGGDHTSDLARLLRLPGTLNRKNERNGDPPVPCSLIECHSDRRYALASFERFAKQTAGHDERPASVSTRQAVPRPKSLDDCVHASAHAEVGKRSEADFALCCRAIRSGASKAETWARVQFVGKFAEEGEAYFDRTWAAAERSVSSGDEGRRGNNKLPPLDSPTHIVVRPRVTPVSATLRDVTDRLVDSGTCFDRSDQVVVIDGDQIASITSASELAGLLNQHVEFYFMDGRKREFKPFPPAYGNTWLNHRDERRRLPPLNLFTRNPVYTSDWRSVAPGYDASSGIFYAGPPVEIRNDTTYLDRLLKDFCFRQPADRTNYLGMLLTCVLMPHFIGSKPAALFNGNQPELGKTILAQIIGITRDGQMTETISYNPNDEEFEKRLGGVVRRGATTLIIDNAKSGTRKSRIDSGCLERSITDPILSFRLLGQSSSIRAENSHIFCLTANAPDLSHDLLTRSAVINLYYEGAPERRTFSIDDPEGYALDHRPEILGELMGMVERWKAAGMPRSTVRTRFNKRGWGQIIGGVLDVCGEPDFLANAEEAAVALDETRREFSELVNVMVDHPQGTWSATELVTLCRQEKLLVTDLGDGSERSQATRMGTLAARFERERFTLSKGGEAVFHRDSGRKGNVYRVDVPNL